MLGNGYSEEWQAEAKSRGLLNLKTTPDVIPHMTSKKNKELFAKFKVFTEAGTRHCLTVADCVAGWLLTLYMYIYIYVCVCLFVCVLKVWRRALK